LTCTLREAKGMVLTMKICNLKPNKILRQYISRYWIWEDEPDLPKLLPGTGTELMFHYHQPFVGINKGKACEMPLCHIIAPRNESHYLKPVNRVGFIAVRFRAGAFRHFCRESSINLIDSFIDIGDLWGKDGADFGQQVLDGKNFKERILTIERFLMVFFARYQKLDQWMDMAVEKVLYEYNTVKLAELSHNFFISERQLQRKFKECVGVSPKVFQINSRFEAVLKQLLLNKRKDYLTIALDNGYYDQAHFIKEFQRYVGQQPSSFLQDRNFMSHFYNEKLAERNIIRV
jgi:AraC-like DNA-binding protein